MIVSPAFAGKRYAVLGLARSGLATVAALNASGADVTAWDDRAEARAMVDRVATLADPMTIDLAGFDGVVVSPGVPLNRHPIAQKAREAGVPVIGDIELFAQARASLPAHKVIGITGTNGKSTTTALIHHIAKTAGLPAAMGGNIGLPILGQDPLDAGGVYVLELSSYQIDLTHSLDCDVAVLLNITPDHLDRYDGFEGYAASKIRLFAMQSAGGDAIITAHGFVGETPISELLDDVFAKTHSSVHPCDVDVATDNGAAIVNGTAQWNGRAFSRQADWPALQGPHNAQNAVASISAARSLGIDETVIARGLETYPGLPHRMERVAAKNGVLFVNDSKATNPTSTAPALAAYPAIHWILGGRAKTDELDACVPHFGHVRAAYTIGESGEMFAELLRPYMPVSVCGDLRTAVSRAAGVARTDETVLLSPACASFDQFTDYEARGDAFRAAVEALV